MNFNLPVAIVGAGPAGLVAARALQKENISFVVYERHSDVGGIWDIKNPGTPMYESAHFISSKTLSGFPDFPMPDHYPDYPTRTQIDEYIKNFATHYQLREHIKFSTSVEKAVFDEVDKTWQITDNKSITNNYRALVCGNGPLWSPSVPTYKGTFTGTLRHSSAFKKSTEFLGQKVLVVGAGNSGVDIACEAASYAEKASLSMRRGYYFIPKHLFGIPADVIAHGGPKLPTWLNQFIFTLMHKLIVGDQSKFGLPKPDHKILESHPVLNSQVMHHTSHGNLSIKPDIDYFEGKTVFFKDGTSDEFDDIILATGFNYKIPYAEQYFDWTEGRPQLFMSLFAPKTDNLFAIGFMETNSAGYEMFTEMAKMMVDYLKSQEKTPELAKEFRQKVANEKLDLSGGIKFIKTARHTGYVDSDTYRGFLKKFQKRMGWSPYKVGYYVS